MAQIKSDFKEILLSVVIPVYNEAGTIKETIDRVLGSPFSKEIIVVDDGSTDETRHILSQIKHTAIRVIFHETNSGKGSAVQTGFDVVNGDIIMIQDADLEYNPDEYPILLKPILTGKADVVYGSRFGGHGEHRVLYFWHYVGNRFLTLLSNMFTDLNLTDMEPATKCLPARHCKASASTRSVSDSNPKSPPKLPEKNSEFMRSRYPITDGPMKKGKKSTGRTDYARCGVFLNIICLFAGNENL
jgi:glycosyltransferase involved in cell wall biosynthesis